MPAAFRLYSKLDTQWGQSGQLLPGGYLKFYTAGTTTPKDVFGEQALTTNNGSTVDLDASGRPDVDVWGSGSYFVELYDADDVKQGEADDVQIPGGEATALPTLDADKFLTNDGSVMSWAEILPVPDPTGSANKILGTDGTTVSWIAKPADGAPGAAGSTVTATSTLSKIATTADGTISIAILRGTGSIAASGAHTASGSAAFGVTFLSAPTVICQPTGGGVTGDGYHPILSASSITTTGFNIAANINEGGTGGGTNISSTVNFSYIAIGTITT